MGMGGSKTPAWRPVVRGAEEQEVAMHHCWKSICRLEAAAAVTQMLGCLAWLLVRWQQVKHPPALQGLSGNMKVKVVKVWFPRSGLYAWHGARLSQG